MKQLVKYMIDISMGMHYLAEKGLVHRVSHIYNVRLSLYLRVVVYIGLPEQALG